MVMRMDFNSKMEQEIETLARTLKNSKLAVSESEARRMAEEMLSTSKKVADDFAERDKRLYGAQPKNKDVELAHKALEQITSNMGKGHSNVRINIGELDLNKPLKDMISSEEEPSDREDDDAVDLSEPKSAPANDWTQSIAEPGSATASKDIESDVDDDSNDDLDSEEEREPADTLDEEKELEEIKEVPLQAPVADGDSDEIGEGGETDFSIKELSEAPKKSEETRKKDIESMEESKVDLSEMFNANK